MTDGTGLAFEHSLRVTEQEYLLAMEDGRLTRRHGFDLVAAHVRAACDRESLKAALAEAERFLADWRVSLEVQP